MNININKMLLITLIVISVIIFSVMKFVSECEVKDQEYGCRRCEENRKNYGLENAGKVVVEDSEITTSNIKENIK